MLRGSLGRWNQGMEEADHLHPRLSRLVFDLLSMWAGGLYPVVMRAILLVSFFAWGFDDEDARDLSLLGVFPVEEPDCSCAPEYALVVFRSLSRCGCFLSGLADFCRRDRAAWYGDPDKNIVLEWWMWNCRLWPKGILFLPEMIFDRRILTVLDNG